MTSEPIATRCAEIGDAATLFDFIRQLAVYERLEHEVRGSVAALARDLGSGACSALIAELGGAAVGFALWFDTYSTFETAVCMHLEDLFVVPAARGRGVGAALLAEVARVAERRGCPRLQWCVLDWNEPAIGFYERIGARVLPDWRVCRVEGGGIAGIARRDRQSDAGADT